MGRNEDKLRQAEEDWLNPDYLAPTPYEVTEDLSTEKPVVKCRICGEAVYRDTAYEVGWDVWICQRCADEVVEMWEERKEEMGY